MDCNSNNKYCLKKFREKFQPLEEVEEKACRTPERFMKRRAILLTLFFSVFFFPWAISPFWLIKRCRDKDSKLNLIKLFNRFIDLINFIELINAISWEAGIWGNAEPCENGSKLEQRLCAAGKEGYWLEDNYSKMQSVHRWSPSLKLWRPIKSSRTAFIRENLVQKLSFGAILFEID